MAITINPYADQITFPAGTPSSVMNMVMQIRARDEALRAQQEAQPKWWETGINNLIGGATNQLLFPWLKNEFVNLPYQKELGAFQTDESIRQSAGIGDATLARQKDLAAWKAAEDRRLQEEDWARQGQAFNAWQQAATPTQTQSYLDATAPNMYDMGYEGSNYGTPPVIQQAQDMMAQGPSMEQTPEAPIPETIPSVEGRTLPGAVDMGGVRQPSVTSIPGETFQPNSLEVMRALVGKDPTLAAVFADLIKGNPALAGMVNPDKQAELAAKLEAQQARISQADQTLAIKQGQLGVNAANVDSQIVKRLRDAGLNDARIAQILGKNVEQDYRNQALGSMTDPQRAATLFKTNRDNPLLKSWSSELALINADPILSGLPDDAKLALAKKNAITTAGLSSQSSAAGRTAGTMETQYNLPMKVPSPALDTKQLEWNRVTSKLTEIKELMPTPERLNQIVGFLSPWLNEAANTGKVGPLPIPPSMMRMLTPKEQQFIFASKDVADIIVHSRTGAQMSEEEFRRVMGFLPTDVTTGPGYMAAWKNAYNTADQALGNTYDQYKGYGQWRGPSRKRNARNHLLSKGFAGSDSQVEKFLSKNPDFGLEE